MADPQVTLKLCSGRGAGQRYTIDARGKVIGRSSTADIPLEDGRASEHHAMVVIREGRCLIYDLGSDTGTYVNDRRVEEADLRHGDRIQVGSSQLELSAEAPKPVAGYLAGGSAQSALAVQPPPGANTQMVAAQMLMNQMAVMQQQQAAMMYPMPPADAEEEGASLTETIERVQKFVAFFRPFIKGFAFLFVLMFGLAMSSLVWMPPKSKAVFAVALTGTPQDNPLRPYQQQGLEFFRSALQSFSSPALIERTLCALGDPELSPDRIEVIQKNLKLEGVGKLGNTITYMGTYKEGVGEDSLRFLGAHVRLFLDSEIEKTLKVIGVQREFLQKQLAQTEKDLRRTERELLEFRKKNIDGLPDQAKQYYDLLFELQKKQSEADVELTRIQSLKRLDRVRLGTESPLIEGRVSTTRPYQAQIIDLQSKIAQARAQGKGEDHPDLIALRTNLAEIERLAKESERNGTSSDIERQRNPAYSSIQDGLRQLEAAEETARSEAGRIRSDLEHTRKVVERLPELETTYSELTRSYATSKELHAKIFGQLKSTQLQYDLERASASARYDLFQPPTLEPDSPVKVYGLRGAIGVVLGLLFGVGYVAFRQFQLWRHDKELQKAREAELSGTPASDGSRGLVRMPHGEAPIGRPID
ncbi:MAG: FHA domain-containing protein [Myxococcota bacterium]